MPLFIQFSIKPHNGCSWRPAKQTVRLLLLLLSLVASVSESGALEASDPATAASVTPLPNPKPANTAPTNPSPSGAIKTANISTKASKSDCAGGEDFRQRVDSANSPAIVYNSNLVPAGSSVDFGVATEIDPGASYFAVLFSDGNIPANSLGHFARARKAAETDDLVAKHLVSAGQTIVSVDVPADVSGFWTKQNLYIYQCSGGSPFHVSYMPVYVSPIGLSVAFTFLIGIAVYYAAAKTLMRRMSGQQLIGIQWWNPIRITAGSDNRGSLSTFQVFFFTLLVFVMLAFVLMRTGVLSDLSTTVLELLGISGIGAAAAKGTDSSRTAIDPANRAWLLNKGWFDAPSIRSDAQPNFFDLISSDGNFDVYRFQSLLFSATVGGALFIGGVSQLASFTVPQNILGILGLSQVVYIAGKLVSDNSASQINAVIADLRSAEADFRETVLTYRPTPDAAIMAPPASLPEAINRVGAAAYAKYFDKAKGAAKLFTNATGLVVDADKLKPSIGSA